MPGAPMTASVKGEDYWTLGKIKRTFHVTEHWMLKFVSLGLIRVAAKTGSPPRYCFSDVKRLASEEFQDASGSIGRLTAVVPVAGEPGKRNNAAPSSVLRHDSERRQAKTKTPFTLEASDSRISVMEYY